MESTRIDNNLLPKPYKAPMMLLRTAYGLFFLLTLASCASTKVGVRTTIPNGLNLDTIALVSTAIGPLFQPVFPLIDAAAFNKKTNDLADVILAEEEILVAEFRQTLLADLRRHVSASFTTVDDFGNGPEIERFRAGASVQTENRNFPVALFAPGDLNVITFDNAKNVDRLFEATPAFTERIKSIAAATGAKSIAVSYNRLAVIAAGAFGASATLRLETHLFVFASNGRQLFEIFGVTKPTTISGKRVEDYSFQLSQFKILSDMMAQELKKHVL